MPCYYPLAAWQTHEGEIHFYKKLHRRTSERNQALNYRRDLDLPCGRCVGCRLERSKQWAVRIMHEAQMHNTNSFITLTYDNDKLIDTHDQPRTATSLVQRDVQLFMKRLRKNLGPKKIKFYAIGEYGPKTQRPHYHIALFGEDFQQDRYEWKKSKNGNQLWRSPRLETIWTQGNCDIGELTFQSAAYIARYIMAKINGDMANEHYKRTNPDTGEEFWILPEFNLMSNGIGKEWFGKYKTDVYPHDYVVHKNVKLKPPRYYDKLLELIDAEQLDIIKTEREKQAESKAGDNTPARLAVKEAVALAKLNHNPRQ